MNAEIKERVEMIQRGEAPKGYKKTKVGIIPEDWEVKRIEYIAHINQDNLSNSTDGEYEFYYFDLSSVSDGEVLKPGDKIKFKDSPSRARRIFYKNDILMSTVRPYLKGFGYIDFETKDCVCSTGFAVISSNDKNDSKYIYHNIFSENIKNQIKRLLVGSNYPAINKTDIEKLKIPYPQHNSERKKIAQILSTWDEAIDLKEKLIEEKQEQKKGLMQNLLTGKVRLPGFEGEWEEVRLGELVKKIKGRTVSYDAKGKHPVIDMEYLDSGVFKNYSDDDSVIASTDDVLLLWDGAKAGKSFTLTKGIVGSTFVKLECKQVNNIYLHNHFVLNENLIMSIREGSGIPHVPKDFLQYYTINLPSLDEQKAIATILSTADREIELLKEEVELLKEQKKGLMQLLLTGIVRVDEAIL